MTTPLVATPSNAVSEVKRNLCNKLFLLDNGQFHLKAKTNAIHVADDVPAWFARGSFNYHDPDLTFARPSGGFQLRNAWFDGSCQNEIGFTFGSKRAGRVSVRLVDIGGIKIFNDGSPYVQGDASIRWDDVIPGVDIIVKFELYGVEIYKYIRDPSAPKTLTWEVRKSRNFVGKIKTDRYARDNWDRSSPNRVVGAGPGICRRQARLLVNRQHIVSGSDDVWLVTETLTGESFVRDPVTQVKTLLPELEYPVMIDDSISETIQADADDGNEFSGVWDIEYAATGSHLLSSSARHPGYRFLTVDIPKDSSISTETLTISIGTISGGTPTGDLFGDVGANRQNAWSVGPLTDMTNSSASAVVSGLVDSTPKVIDMNGIIAEITSLGGGSPWASGQNLRMGIIADGSGYAYIQDRSSGVGLGADLDVVFTPPAAGIDQILNQQPQIPWRHIEIVGY